MGSIELATKAPMPSPPGLVPCLGVSVLSTMRLSVTRLVLESVLVR
jgi:hypothetical protein